MQTPRPFEVVFLTNFSNSSYRAIPALAQMADEIDTHITILHASEPGTRQAHEDESRLASFFPDAGTYRKSSRVNYSGDVVAAVNNLSLKQPVDLIVAPSADPLGWPRLLHTSLRSRIIRECSAPLWTMGTGIHSAVFSRKTKNVGCWVDLASPSMAHISMAFEYASKIDARFHLLHALPEIDEGSLALPLYYNKPLSAKGAGREIGAMLGWMPVPPEIHIAPGSPRRVMPQLAADLSLDILFAEKTHSLRFDWMLGGISSAVDRCPCPVICCGPSSGKTWRLRRGPAFQTRVLEPRAA